MNMGHLSTFEDHSPTRRTVMVGLGVVGVMASLGEANALVAEPPHRIDVHYHHITPEWISEEIVRRTMSSQVIGMAQAWTPERALAEMDANGVATVVCSVSNPGIWFGDIAQARRLSRACNEYAAQLGKAHPKRFGSFAALPMPDVEGSLAEIAHALDVLHADGVGIFTSYGDKWLSDPSFAPIFAELNRRKAVVYVHPMAPFCCRNLMAEVSAALLEYPFDTARTMLQWILDKQSAQYPALRLIFSHAGAVLMSSVGRLQLLSDTHPQFGMSKDFRADVARFHYELSSSTDKATMTLLRSYVPTERLLLGTDSPFIGPMAPNIQQLQRIGLTPSDLAKIERGNALALLPTLQRRA